MFAGLGLGDSRFNLQKKKKNYYIYALISNVSIIILSRPSTQFYLLIDVAFFILNMSLLYIYRTIMVFF